MAGKKKQKGMPVLQTERLRIRPLAHTDIQGYYDLVRRPEVGRGAGWLPIAYSSQALIVLLHVIDQANTWAIEEIQGGAFVGTISLSRDKRRNYDDAKEVGYALRPAFWGKGYAPEAVRAMMAYAFDVCNAVILCADHYPFNDRSKRVLEKCGFTYEGCLRRACALGDEIFDHTCYSITKEEYESDQNAAPTSL